MTPDEETADRLRARVRELTDDVTRARASLAHVTSQLGDANRTIDELRAQLRAPRDAAPAGVEESRLRGWLRRIASRSRGLGAAWAASALHSDAAADAPTTKGLGA